MKRQPVKSVPRKIAAPALVVILATALGLVAGSDARAGQPNPLAATKPRYVVTILDSLGGTISRANSLDDAGWASGYSFLAGNAQRRATLWRDGRPPLDLGALGGPAANSSIVWPVKNNIGLLVGISQTATPDPLGEAWSCSAFIATNGNTCLGFAWRNGTMRALPTLGGNNGFAAGANNLGQITGWAENDVHDGDCVPPQQLQFRPVVWGPGPNAIRELPLYPGDTSGAATGINDRGQAIGISGRCDQAVGRFSAIHALLWENGAATLLPDLGAGMWNTPMAINQRGDVVGFVAQPGDDPDNPRLRAFLWTKKGGFRNLGTLGPQHDYSEAHAINAAGQVVGVSCVSGSQPLTCRAFLWHQGVMSDLNALVAPSSTVLINGQDINDRGEISGRALTSTGARPAFVAKPRR